jgi:hypothetical protein
MYFLIFIIKKNKTMAIKLRGLTSESTIDTPVMETLPNEFETKEEALDFVKANLALSTFDPAVTVICLKTETEEYHYLEVFDDDAL